ncbi:MAG: ThuA domain-containing protein [Alphaproteobacteria bacterium]
MIVDRRKLIVGVAAMALAATPAFAATRRRPRLLVFTKATGYVHPSIQPGIDMLRGVAAREGYDIEATDDPDIFSDANLARFDLLVLLCCTTDSQHPDSEWLIGSRRDALQSFVHGGKPVVGIHAAADSHHHWPWYGQMIGGYFDRHPANPNVRPGHLIVVDRNDPSTRGLPATIDRQDEWYLFRDFNPMVHLLIAAEVTSVYTETDPLNMQWFSSQTNTNTRMRFPEANPKPISWHHDFEGARVFYTAMGHTPETFSEPLPVAHITGGIRWALGHDR